MTDELAVLIEGRLAGRLMRRRGGTLLFRYDEGYQGLVGPTPLSVAMPAGISEHAHRAIAPWVAGLLPDNELVIQRWSRTFHVAATPFALLGSPVGEDCAGAVQLVSPDRASEILSREGSVTWLEEADVAERLRALKADQTAWLGATSTGQFSLAGAQPKMALLRDGGRWGEPNGSIPTTHILKPAVAGLDDHDLNEHLCLDAAGRCGLLSSNSRVERFEDQSAIVVERYDRRSVGVERRLVRVHQEDFCQALSIEPGRKYEAEGGAGAIRIIALLRAVMGPGDARIAIGRFVDALIWNWLIAGTDGHAKNYSLLLSGDQIRLAPLYDVASALPYGLHERKLRLAMRVGRSYAVALTHDPWRRGAEMWGMPPDEVRARVRELAARAADAFSTAAAAPAVGELDSHLPARLTDLVAERAVRCRAIVT